VKSLEWQGYQMYGISNLNFLVLNNVKFKVYAVMLFGNLVVYRRSLKPFT
jgi:hypothetical protein